MAMVNDLRDLTATPRGRIEFIIRDLLSQRLEDTMYLNRTKVPGNCDVITMGGIQKLYRILKVFKHQLEESIGTLNNFGFPRSIKDLTKIVAVSRGVIDEPAKLLGLRFYADNHSYVLHSLSEYDNLIEFLLRRSPEHRVSTLPAHYNDPGFSLSFERTKPLEDCVHGLFTTALGGLVL